jgi:hypothetical protein
MGVTRASAAPGPIRRFLVGTPLHAAAQEETSRLRGHRRRERGPGKREARVPGRRRTPCGPRSGSSQNGVTETDGTNARVSARVRAFLATPTPALLGTPPVLDSLVVAYDECGRDGEENQSGWQHHGADLPLQP